MKLVVQKVSSASVTVDALVSRIGPGLLLLVGITHNDGQKDIDYLVNKICKLRIFPDESGFMNKSVQDVNGEILCVSQFTLYSDCNKGNRPSFTDAMKSDYAEKFYERFLSALKAQFPNVKDGEFGAHMQVELVNDGPVTIILETP